VRSKRTQEEFLSSFQIANRVLGWVPRPWLSAAAEIPILRRVGRRMLGSMNSAKGPRPILTIAHGPLKGCRIRHDPYTDGERMWLGIDEVELERCLAKTLSAGQIAYDLGAAVGLYALQMAKLVGPTGRVIALEPCPDVFPLLAENLRINGFAHAEAIEAAAGGECGIQPFGVSDKADLALGVSIGGTLADLTGKHTVPVRVYTLDSLVYEKGCPVPNVVKMDVQEAETSVLLGAGRLIQEAHPTFLIELHTPEQGRNVFQILTAAGYRILNSRTNERVTTGEQAGLIGAVWGNCLATFANGNS
jgi:FkbM family methyltransferase